MSEIKTYEEVQLEADKKAKELCKILSLEFVKVIIVAVDEDKGDYAVGYFKPPMRNAVSIYMRMEEKDLLGAKEQMLRDCMLKDNSDSRLLDDDQCFFAAVREIDDIVFLKKSISNIVLA